MKFLPTKIHGLLDYIVGAALIAAPTLFRFREVGGAAVIIPTVIGIVLIAYSFFTDYEWGVVKKIPMGYHLLVDYLASGLPGDLALRVRVRRPGPERMAAPPGRRPHRRSLVVLVSKPGISLPRPRQLQGRSQ